MNKFFLVLMVFLITGCATARYGNYLLVNAGLNQTLAQDAEARLITLYPPAKTTFCLNQAVRDGFGLTLIDLLRKKGYRIQERCTNAQANFFYTVDAPIKNSLYRVTLWIGSQSLSRAYGVQAGIIKPISVWSYKE